MALYKPLVRLTNGQISQLPPGDTLEAPSTEVDIITLANAEASPVSPTKAVYKTGTTNQFMLAIATTAASAKVIGFTKETIANGTSGFVQTDGVIGGFVGLVPGTEYFLSPTVAGEITATPPSTLGQYSAKVGTAVSSTELEISISLTIQL